MRSPVIAITAGLGIASSSKGHLLVGVFKSLVCSPGCWTLKNKVLPSGENQGPVNSASLGAEATRNTYPKISC